MTVNAMEAAQSVEWAIGAMDDPQCERGICTLAEYVEANGEECVPALLAGETVIGGGGAAPEWSARIVATGGGA